MGKVSGMTAATVPLATTEEFHVNASLADRKATIANVIEAVTLAAAQPNILDRTLTAPPGSPAAGDAYIPAATATGAWAGQEDDVAVYLGGAWRFFTPDDGWSLIDSDAGQLLRFVTGTGWVVVIDFALFVTDAGNSRVGINGASPAETLHVFGDQIAAESANAARMGLFIAEEHLTSLSGATVDTTITIPAGAIVFNVSVRVTTAVTGATTFDVGTAASASKFAAAVAIALDTTDLGSINPEAFAAATAIRLTANGSNFTGGDVRVAIHYYLPAAPGS